MRIVLIASCLLGGSRFQLTTHREPSIWHWRNQYGEVLGGLGTGIGDGDRGVICGREGHCLAAKEVEQETDCDAADAREGSPSNRASSENALSWPATSLYSLGSGSGHANGTHSHQGDQRRTPSPLQLGPGYERHEIVGIGGVVKRKLVRVVRVGACVPEWEDERSRSGLLRRERTGQIRSFCGWCCRVIPGKSDQEEQSASSHAVAHVKHRKSQCGRPRGPLLRSSDTPNVSGSSERVKGNGGYT